MQGVLKLTLWRLTILIGGRTAPLTSKRFILYIYSTNIGTNILNMVYTLRFFSFSKCSLFHYSNVFGSCIIHILYTGCAKINKIIPAPKVLILIKTYTTNGVTASYFPFPLLFLSLNIRAFQINFFKTKDKSILDFSEGAAVPRLL